MHNIDGLGRKLIKASKAIALSGLIFALGSQSSALAMAYRGITPGKDDLLRCTKVLGDPLDGHVNEGGTRTMYYRDPEAKGGKTEVLFDEETEAVLAITVVPKSPQFDVDLLDTKPYKTQNLEVAETSSEVAYLFPSLNTMVVTNGLKVTSIMHYNPSQAAKLRRSVSGTWRKKSAATVVRELLADRE